MGELPDLPAEPGVGGIVCGVVEGVFSDDFAAAVKGVAGVVGKVYFAQEALLVVFEFADHDCGLKRAQRGCDGIGFGCDKRSAVGDGDGEIWARVRATLLFFVGDSKYIFWVMARER